MSEMFFVLVKSSSYLISPVCLQPIMKKSLFLRFFKVSVDQTFRHSDIQTQGDIFDFLS